jgi:hypothetical protein
MPRRSYLHRIAEPLSPGDPVLFAVPRPPPEEARAASEMQTPTPAAPSRAPTLRRRASASAAPAATATTQHATAAPVATGAASFVPSPRASASDQPIAAAPPVPLSTQPPPIAGERTTRITPPAAPAPDEATERQHGPTGQRVVESASASPLVLPGDAAPRDLVSISAVSDPPPKTVAPTARTMPVVPDPFDEPQPARLPTPGGRATPRIHIGTVEVRSATPALPQAPPPPAPRAAPASPRGDTASISRGYAWRFGLVQG